VGLIWKKGKNGTKKCFAFALKESGNFDLYQSFMLKDSVDSVKALDITMTLNAYHFLIQDEKEGE